MQVYPQLHASIFLSDRLNIDVEPAPSIKVGRRVRSLLLSQMIDAEELD